MLFWVLFHLPEVKMSKEKKKGFSEKTLHFIKNLVTTLKREKKIVPKSIAKNLCRPIVLPIFSPQLSFILAQDRDYIYHILRNCSAKNGVSTDWCSCIIRLYIMYINLYNLSKIKCNSQM